MNGTLLVTSPRRQLTCRGMKPSVVVVGSYVQDLAWRCAEFPRAGETVVGSFVSGPGGKGSNQAVAAARAGAATCFIGAVGWDAFSRTAREFYRSEGIAARFVGKPRHATATAGILVNASGQNEIIVALGASAQLRPRDVDPALIRGARVVVCQHEASLGVNAHVFRLARRAGVTTVLNPAPMRSDFDPAILGLTDVLAPNESELVALANRLRTGRGAPLSTAKLAALTPDALQRHCRALGVATVIVTLGARGCFVSQPDRFATIAGHRVRAVDTTGAGDGFVGGFAAGLVKFDGDIMPAARFANAVGALSVTKPGTAPSMPRTREIARFLSRRRTAGRTGNF